MTVLDKALGTALTAATNQQVPYTLIILREKFPDVKGQMHGSMFV